MKHDGKGAVSINWAARVNMIKHTKCGDRKYIKHPNILFSRIEHLHKSHLNKHSYLIQQTLIREETRDQTMVRL